MKGIGHVKQFNRRMDKEENIYMCITPSVCKYICNGILFSHREE